MTQPGFECSPKQKTIGLVILFCLAAIGAGIFLQQFSFNPAVLAARQAESQTAGAPLAEPGAGEPTALVSFPPELKPFGPPEHFTPDNLYDKIDGKAELYLTAGIVGMRCQRFALRDAPDQWLEWFIYDMGKLPQAFSVFSTQRRTDSRPLAIAEHGYETENSIYFVSGAQYIEAIASNPAEPLLNAMRAMAARYLAAAPRTGARLTEFDLLPPDNLVPGSQTLQAADVFGFDRFKNVYTARYRENGTETLAFVMSCPDPAAAASLSGAYRAFLLENGGRETGTADPVFGSPIEIMGATELVFAEGPFVAGIHAAPRLEVARLIAGRLQQRLARAK